jgi:tripeptidyl-peptidase-1
MLLATSKHMQTIIRRLCLIISRYHVPEHLVDHIDYVTPGIKLAKLMKHTPTQSPANEVQKRAIKQKREDFYLPPVPGPIPTQLSAQVSSPDAVIDAKDFTICNIYIAPQCVPVLYNVSLPSNTTAAAAGPRQIGIFEDIGQWWDQKDLNQFYKQTGLNIPQGFGPKENSVDGAPGPQPQAQAGLESMLDLSLVIPLVYPSQPIYFQVDDLPTELNYTYDGESIHGECMCLHAD